MKHMSMFLTDQSPTYLGLIYKPTFFVKMITYKDIKIIKYYYYYK